MIYTDLQQVLMSTSSLTYASYFSPEDQEYLQSNYTLLDFPFGQSKKDYIEVSVFAMDGTPISTSYFIPTGSYTNYSKSYYDVNNTYVTYSYSDFQSDLVVVGSQTQSVFLDVAQQINVMGIREGSYKVGIQLIRDIVGSSQDSKQRLFLKTISPSRTEITVVPTTLRSDTSNITNEEFYSFSNNKVIFKDVSDQILSGIGNPNIYNIYIDAVSSDPTGSSNLFSGYGFKTGVDVVNFLIDTYYGVNKGSRQSSGKISQNRILGIFDQFSNWMDQNLNEYATFQDIRDQYYSLCSFIIDKNLNGINGINPVSYGSIINFLQSIYYTMIFYPTITQVEASYVDYITGYFKNYLNFGDDRLFPIMNMKVIPSADPTQHDQLAIKLKDALPNDLVISNTLWIENIFASAPILQNIYYFSNPVIAINKLRGPNFNVKFQNEGNSTETLSLESLIGETGSLYNEILTKLNSHTSSLVLNTVDYRYFEKFVNFSTADLRLKAYTVKLNSIYQYNQDVATASGHLIENPNDQFYQNDLEQANTSLNAVIASFDGYEKFLYRNPTWYSIHTSVGSGGITSASLYDRNNRNSLINGLPAIIVEDPRNSDYVKFVGMVGHFFDNISIYIDQFTQKLDSAASPNRGISMDLVHNELVSLGWEPEISRENLPLILSSFSKSDFDTGSVLYNDLGAISENDRNKLIWKRILSNLPFIYKTKGTAASINALISCFGIPKNLIKIKEYGSIDYNPNTDDAGWFIFEENKYLPYFSGSGEYFQTPWTGSINSVEFDVNFDTDHTNNEGDILYLVNNKNNWTLGAVKDSGTIWGRLFFTISNGTGSLSTLVGPPVPLFDGTTYTVMLRKDYVGNSIDYPTEYEMLVRKSDGGRIVFSTGSSFVLSGSCNNIYESGSSICFGNYRSSSLESGRGEFWGNIDEIKLWEIPIDNNTFEEHALYRGGFNYSDPQTMVDKLLFRMSFNQPIDLYITSSLPNVSFRADFPTFSAVNFAPVTGLDPNYPECNIPDSSPIWPYQFTVEEYVIQSAKVSSYGSATLRSNKIAYFDQTLTAGLSSTARSTQQSIHNGTVDSNKIGIFFSPIDIENEGILKFFGAYDFGDLIGDPSDTYEKTYRRFEQFRQIYYDNGHGIIDYQTFMNLIKAYFDKAMFKYMQSIVPARSNLVEGLLIEPTLLERPKIQMKSVGVENITQFTCSVKLNEKVSAKSTEVVTGYIPIEIGGTSILNDVNQTFYKDAPDDHGFGLYAINGTLFYKNDYYRIDVMEYEKSYQTQRKYSAPTDKLNFSSKSIDLNGTVQTVSNSYYKLNLIRLPIVSEYEITASYAPDSSIHFNGYIDIPLSSSAGLVNSVITIPHTINGTVSGDIAGFRLNDPVIWHYGTLYSETPVSASFNIGSSVLYSGYFNIVNNQWFFAGYITINPGATYDMEFSTGHTTQSIYDYLRVNSTGELFTSTDQVRYRLEKSLEITPNNSRRLNGYFQTHYKHKRRVFSQKELNVFTNTYDQSGNPINGPSKWKRGSQTRKSTVDASTGNLDNSDPIQITA
jgi:hypothetical protein